MSQLTWYLAVLVVSSRVDDGEDVLPLNELQFRLVHAADSEAAYARALELGEHETGLRYQNIDGHDVVWTFKGLHELRQIIDQDLSDGTQIYSEMDRDDPQKFIVPKDRLTVFWAEANKDRTIREILSGDDA